MAFDEQLLKKRVVCFSGFDSHQGPSFGLAPARSCLEGHTTLKFHVCHIWESGMLSVLFLLQHNCGAKECESDALEQRGGALELRR